MELEDLNVDTFLLEGSRLTVRRCSSLGKLFHIRKQGELHVIGTLPIRTAPSIRMGRIWIEFDLSFSSCILYGWVSLQDFQIDISEIYENRPWSQYWSNLKNPTLKKRLKFLVFEGERRSFWAFSIRASRFIGMQSVLKRSNRFDPQNST